MSTASQLLSLIKALIKAQIDLLSKLGGNKNSTHYLSDTNRFNVLTKALETSNLFVSLR